MRYYEITTEAGGLRRAMHEPERGQLQYDVIAHDNNSTVWVVSSIDRARELEDYIRTVSGYADFLLVEKVTEDYLLDNSLL